MSQSKRHLNARQRRRLPSPPAGHTNKTRGSSCVSFNCDINARITCGGRACQSATGVLASENTSQKYCKFSLHGNIAPNIKVVIFHNTNFYWMYKTSFCNLGLEANVGKHCSSVARQSNK